MQNIIIDKPYAPVPPHRSTFWQTILQFYLPRMLRKQYGVTQVHSNNIERLTESYKAGHSIVLASNHCRDSDPLVMGMLGRLAHVKLYIMASWHLFMQDWLKSFLLPRAGAFSIYREGVDRTAVNTAVELLECAQRPLVIFPEGYISRTNDQLNELMDGVSLIARTAAKRRAKLNPPGKVVVHPIALRYHFDGSVESAGAEVLDEIETRLTWQPTSHLPLEQRIYKIGAALLALKELEYLNEPRIGEIGPRVQQLIEAILAPLENEWAKGQHDGTVAARVKRIRAAILPDMVKGDISPIEHKRRWKHLADCYLAMQLVHYPPDYVKSNPSPQRMFETIERFEEDLTDMVRVHGESTVTINVGTAIEVNPNRQGRDETDPLLEAIASQMREMLAKS
ncbi:MAG TPA: 1-acyl-sn-glycerol-3-phosphate acyltransferase [Tepidisphaeraceae bacterium]|nr:1-acyl-sn-glycerol-3-phosphate acyltransferase [Tepidisphaeraceae bacterium]